MGDVPRTAGTKRGDGADLKLGETRTLTPAVKYVIQEFLEEKHLTTLNTSLAQQWDMHQSLTAAMKLMETYGVSLTPEEEAQITALDEISMVEALVSKMPQQSKEQFENFFLQLQLIVSTAQRVRRGLEEGNTDHVERALDDAESTGIMHYILKMSIVQAGSEVSNLRSQHQKWVLETDHHMSELLRGKDDAMQAQKNLAAAQQQLASFTTSHNEKAKRTLMNLCGGKSKAAVSMAVSAWRTITKKEKHEKLIWLEYEDRFQEANQRLIDYRESQLSNVRGVLTRKAAANDEALLLLCFNTFRGDVEERKHDAEQQGAVHEVEARLAAFKTEQKENTKKVMSRMAAASEQGTVNMCYQAWGHFIVEYKKNKGLEDQVKASEQKFAAYMKDKASSAKAVMARLTGASDSGLLHNVLEEWYHILIEEKEAHQMEDLLNSEESKFSMFASRNSESAKDVMRKATLQLEAFSMMRSFNVWRMDTKVEVLIKSYNGKVEGKRGQLQKVQGLFRSFAGQLENSLKESTPRDPSQLYKKKLTKNEQTVSLPDIHARPAQLSGGRPGIRGSSGRRAASISGRRAQDAAQEQRPTPKAAWAAP